jgi:Outer membrane protein beta-barrel domain
MKSCVLFLWTALVVFAQPVSFGLTAGVSVSPLLTSRSPDYEATTKRYTLGPSVELRLPYRFAFEVDLLYKQLDYRLRGAVSADSRSGSPASAAVQAGRWELPLLIKYGFSTRPQRAFVHLGASFNRVLGTQSDGFVEARHKGVLGLVAGVGVETRFHALRVAPEVRFTHWTDRNFGVRDAPLRSNLNQAEFVVGFRL